MKYANLTKRSNSKLRFTLKRLASVGMFSLVVASFVMLPMLSKEETLNASNNVNEVIDIEIESTSDLMF